MMYRRKSDKDNSIFFSTLARIQDMFHKQLRHKTTTQRADCGDGWLHRFSNMGAHPPSPFLPATEPLIYDIYNLQHTIYNIRTKFFAAATTHPAVAVRGGIFFTVFHSQLNTGEVTGGSLRMLPVRLMACKHMLVLFGQTYQHRMWCISELFVLLAVARLVGSHVYVSALVHLGVLLALVRQWNPESHVSARGLGRRDAPMIEWSYDWKRHCHARRRSLQLPYPPVS